ETVTWSVAQHTAETADAIGKASREKNPGVGANGVRSTAQVAFQRLSQDMRANTAPSDRFRPTRPSHALDLKQEGLLMKYVPENQDEVIEAYRGGDPDGFYHTTQVALVALAYNTKLVKPEDAPKNWPDLLDPKWKNQVSVSHPGFSGRVGNWV